MGNLGINNCNKLNKTSVHWGLGSDGGRRGISGALEEMPAEMFVEIFSYVPIGDLIGNDASAVQFVCREFFVYVDKNIFFSVKERAVELLGLEDDAVKLYCMKYCLGNYGGVFIPRMDRFFVEDEMILRVWGSFVGSKYRDLRDKGGAISRQIASVVARGVLGECMDMRFRGC